ncbi:MAG: hypothetical protein L6R42_006647 [Xanthoria sp. 1 TBL-2021]|nr:MAG: hypothetical protein L6R42_006647 [Xanthoria sp. 1 TBL-2021]
MSKTGSSKQTASPTPFRFLSLPLEIRRLTYHELLLGAVHWRFPKWYGTSYRSYVLYNDRTERQQKLLLHVEILRANKQINAEATPILYEQNAFLIDLSSRVTYQGNDGMYLDRRGNPPHLLRADGHPPKPHFRAPGVIYPHCVQRLANIEIIVSAGSIWGSGYTGSEFFTHIGELLLDLLQLLAFDETTQNSDTQKHLVFTVKKGYDSRWGGDALFPRKREGSRFSRNSDTARTGEKSLSGQVGPLLKTLCERRKVGINEVIECTFIEWEDKHDGQRCEKRTVEVKQRWVPFEEIESL